MKRILQTLIGLIVLVPSLWALGQLFYCCGVLFGKFISSSPESAAQHLAQDGPVFTGFLGLIGIICTFIACFPIYFVSSAIGSVVIKFCAPLVEKGKSALRNKKKSPMPKKRVAQSIVSAPVKDNLLAEAEAEVETLLQPYEKHHNEHL